MQGPAGPKGDKGDTVSVNGVGPIGGDIKLDASNIPQTAIAGEGGKPLSVNDALGTLKEKSASLSGADFTGKVTVKNVYTVVYVATNGNDNNSGLSASSPFRTIAKAVKYISSLVTNEIIELKIADGTYNESDFLIVKTQGALRISGNDNDKSKVIINNSNFISLQSDSVQMSGITVNCSHSFAAGIILVQCGRAAILNCAINSTSGFGGVFGFEISSPTVIQDCVINNCKQSAIIAYGGGVANVINNTGTGNGISLNSVGGIILAAGTIPTASTNYGKVNGGVIFKDGVQV